MPTGQGASQPEPSGNELTGVVEALRRRVEELEQEKQDLEVMLDTATEHADNVSESIEEERNDLATMLEMTTEHADVVEDELHERAEEALRRSERQLRMIVEATPVPVVISRLSDRIILYANRSAGELLGRHGDDLLGLRITEFYDKPAEWPKLIESLGDDAAVDAYELELHKENQGAVWVAIALRRLEFDDDEAVLAALYDITERKHAEQRLQKQVEELRLELDEASLSTQLAQATGISRFDNLDAKYLQRGSTRLIAIHSFRGGNGKSSITANLAGLLAARGLRVGVVDADLQSPGMHVLLGQAGGTEEHTLNEFLLGTCGIHQVARDVTSAIGGSVPGQVFLLPASADPGAMAQVLSQGYEAQRLTQSFHEFATARQLDVLLIDTHSGLNEEALLTMRAADILLVVLRADAQDFDGTGVTVQVARKLEVPHLFFLVNQLPDTRQLQAVRSRVEQTYAGEVLAILPQAEEFMSFDNDGVFVLTNMEHPISVALRHATTRLMEVNVTQTSNAASE